MTDEVTLPTESVAEETPATPETLLAQGETEASAEATPETVEAADYEPFTYPENAIVDEALQAEFKLAAKEAGLTQQQAQTLTDLGAKMQAQMLATHQANQQALFEGWADQSKADKEFGGDKLNANLALASKAMDAFATPELKELLNASGLCNHPEMIRAFYRAGKAMSEDNLVPGGKAPAGEQTLADRLYSKS